MPFKNGGITAKSAEEYLKCEKLLDELNKLVQLLNGREIVVRINPAIVGDGIVVTPVVNSISEIRIMPNAAEGFWVDYNTQSKTIHIRAGDKLIYRINLDPN